MHKLLLCIAITLCCAIPSFAQEKNTPAKNTADSLEADKNIKLAKEYTYNNPSLGKKYAKTAIGNARSAGSTVTEAAATNTLGLCHRNLSEYDSAIVVFRKAAHLFRQNENKSGYGNAMNNIAMTYFYLGDYEKSNVMLMEVIKDADKHNLYKVLSNAYQNLGILNTSQERFNDALENFKLAEYHHDKAKDLRGKAGAAINQGFIYFKHLKDYDKAIAIYNKVIPIKQSLKDEKGVGICLNNLAEIYMAKKDFTKALININKALEIRIKIDDQYGLVNSYHILADIYLQQKKYREAEVYAKKSAAIANKIGAKKEYSEVLKLLSKIQMANNNVSSAYSNYVSAVALKDSLLNRENFAKMAELETKYESERKERQILLQRAQLAENQLKIDQQKNIIYLAVLIGLVATMFVYFIYNRQKIKNLKLKKEAELKDALLFIETQNKLQEQRLQISRDLHDNIGSQLTFIISSLDNLKYTFDIANEGLKNKIVSIRNFTRETITELRDTIWAMNKEEITLVDLRTRISNFIDNAKAASKGIDFTFEIDGDIPANVSFTSLKGISLYRVIQEAIHNALKHAGASRIHVAITTNSGNYIITISDNGTGFNTADTALGNGLANIRKRITECGGMVAITSSCAGTTITVTMK